MTHEKALHLLIKHMESYKTYIKCEIDIAKESEDEDRKRTEMGRLFLISALLNTAYDLDAKATN